MAQPIVAVRGFVGSLTINAVAFKLAKWSVSIQADVMSYAVTGQTADGDNNYWKNKLAGLLEGSLDIEFYYDHAVTAASRYAGSTYNVRPGTTASGAIQCLFTTGGGFSGSVVVKNIKGGIDAEGSKPDSFTASCEFDGAVTYINA